MKKQYTYTEGASFRYHIVLFHDGVQVSTVKKWQGKDLDDYIDQIEDEGYTYGYLPEDVEESRQEYENRKAKAINLKGEVKWTEFP